MKTNIPNGIYKVQLEHHPNQRVGNFIATVVDGDLAGKGFMYHAQGAPWIPPTVRSIKKGRKDEN